MVGQVCHQVLAVWDFRAAADPAGAVTAACKVLSQAEPRADWASVRTEAEAILRGFLGSETARDLAEAEILGRELPFIYGEEGTVVRGTIDLVYRKAGRLFVADYKSEEVSARDLLRLREKYRRQGEDYCAALARAWGQTARFRLIFLRRPELA